MAKAMKKKTTTKAKAVKKPVAKKKTVKRAAAAKAASAAKKSAPKKAAAKKPAAKRRRSGCASTSRRRCATPRGRRDCAGTACRSSCTEIRRRTPAPTSTRCAPNSKTGRRGLERFEISAEEGYETTTPLLSAPGDKTPRERTVIRLSKNVEIRDLIQKLVVRTSDVVVDREAGTAEGSAPIEAQGPGYVARGKGFRLDRAAERGLEILEGTEFDAQDLVVDAQSTAPSVGANTMKPRRVQAKGGHGDRQPRGREGAVDGRAHGGRRPRRARRGRTPRRGVGRAEDRRRRPGAKPAPARVRTTSPHGGVSSG